MISKSRWHVRDKWKRHLALVGNRQVVRHIPPTRLLTGKRSLSEYLERYRTVFVKPSFGSFGNNIIKITKAGKDYLVQREKTIRRVPKDRIASVVTGHTKGKPFLLQKGVTLMTVNGKPLDFRLLLLRPDAEWLVMGIMGKIAGDNRIVTNFNHGGKPIGFEAALHKAGIGPERAARIRKDMYRIGLAASRTFNSRYKHCRRMGIDFALDTEGRLWIIEVNTNPYYELFRYHKNRSLYGTIGRYMKRIGRFQTKR